MPKTNLLATGAACGVLLMLPAAASAATTTAAPAAPSPGGMVFSDPDAPTVFADGSTLTAPAGELVGDAVTVTGTVAGTKPGDSVVVQRADAVAGWVTEATTTVLPDGTYSATFKADRALKTTLRAVPASTAATAASRAVAATGAGAVVGRAITMYRPAKATWYGPGFWGKKTACGVRLRKATLGVANKSLPCGTMVDLYNNGETVTVPVIDRGPFKKGTSYDLTAATAQAIGVVASQTIGAVRSAPATTAAPAATAATR